MGYIGINILTPLNFEGGAIMWGGSFRCAENIGAATKSRIIFGPAAAATRLPLRRIESSGRGDVFIPPPPNGLRVMRRKRGWGMQLGRLIDMVRRNTLPRRRNPKGHVGTRSPKIVETHRISRLVRA